MFDNAPVMTPLRFCPLCGEPLELIAAPERGKMNACKSNSCDYMENKDSGPIVSVLSSMMMKHARNHGILAATIQGHELKVAEAFRPDALMPLLVERAYRTHTLAGLQSVKGLEYPLKSIFDKFGLIKYRVVYDPLYNNHGFHTAALQLVDAFAELIYLTQKVNTTQFKDFVNFDILIEHLTNKSPNIHHDNLFTMPLSEGMISASKHVLEQSAPIVTTLSPGSIR